MRVCADVMAVCLSVSLSVCLSLSGWRRLPRPEIRGGFVANMLRRRTEGVFSKELNR